MEIKRNCQKATLYYQYISIIRYTKKIATSTALQETTYSGQLIQKSECIEKICQRNLRETGECK